MTQASHPRPLARCAILPAPATGHVKAGPATAGFWAPALGSAGTRDDIVHFRTAHRKAAAQALIGAFEPDR